MNVKLTENQSKQLVSYIEGITHESHFYILSNGEVVQFEYDIQKFKPWHFNNRNDAQRFCDNYNSRNIGKYYQVIETTESIENWTFKTSEDSYAKVK